MDFRRKPHKYFLKISSWTRFKVLTNSEYFYSLKRYEGVCFRSVFVFDVLQVSMMAWALMSSLWSSLKSSCWMSFQSCTQKEHPKGIIGQPSSSPSNWPTLWSVTALSVGLNGSSTISTHLNNCCWTAGDWGSFLLELRHPMTTMYQLSIPQ